MDCPQYNCIINRQILTMGAFLLLFLCSVQGFSSAVQTYSELIYPVPRHKVRNLENPVPQLLPASFQCSKDIPCGYCGPLERPVKQYSSVTRYTEGSDVQISALVSDVGKGSIQVFLCVRNDSSKNENEACVQDIQLYIPETNNVEVPVTPSTEMLFSVRLPRGITCQNCILRWRLTEADPSCPGCILTTINCADIAIDARALRRKRQSGPKKSKKTKKTKKTKMPLLPPLRSKETTAAPTKSTTRAPSFFEMVKQIVARQEVDPNIQSKGLNVIRNTQPPPNYYRSIPLYVTPKVNPAHPNIPQVPRTQSRVPVAPSPPAYANLRNVPGIPNSKYVLQNNKWQHQTMYSSGVNTLEKPEFRDKDGIIQKAAPSNAFLEAIRRFKKEKMGLDEMIHNDKPQMGEFHDNVDITRVKKVEKPENLIPSDNALIDKGKYQKGMLPSKYDYFDKTPKTQAPTTTTKITTTKPKPTTVAPTTIRTRPPKKEGVRNLARNTFLEAIMKLTGGESSGMPDKNVNSRNIQSNEPAYSSVNEMKQVNKIIEKSQNKQLDTKESFIQAIEQVEPQQRKILQETQDIQSKRPTTEQSSTLSPTSKSTLKAATKKGLLPKWDSKKSKTTKYTTTSTAQSTSSTTKYTKAQMSTKYDPSYETTTGINVYNPQENPLTDVLPMEDNPYMNFFVILPPMDKGESGNEGTASDTTMLVDTYPAENFTTTNTVNREFTSQSTFKSTQQPTKTYSQSVVYTASKTTLQPTYRTPTTPNADVHSKSAIEKTTEKKTSPSGLLARLAAKDTTKTTKTTTTKKVTSPVHTPSHERFTTPPSTDSPLSTKGESLKTNKVTSSSYLPSNEGTKQSKSSPFLPLKENTEQPKTTLSSTITLKANNQNVGLLNMDSLITDKVTPSPYSPSNERIKQSKSSPFLPFKENTEQPKTTISSTTTLKANNQNVGLLNMDSLITDKVTPSSYSPSNQRIKQSKSSPFLPFKENTEQPKTTSSSTTTPKAEKENVGLLNMDFKPKSLLNQLPMSSNKDKSMHNKIYTASTNTVSSTTQIQEETPINDVSALAFKELFEPDTFKDLQNKITKNVHSTSTTQEIPSTSVTKSTADSATNNKLESTQASSTSQLHAEMHKNNNNKQSYDLLEKELHDKMVEYKTNAGSSVPVYLDTIHADMYKIKSLDEKRKSELPSRITTAPAKEKKLGGLLPLLEPITSEKKKKSGFLLPMPEMPAKSSVDYRSRSKSSMTTARATVTQAPFTSPSSTSTQTTRTSTAPFESSLMEKMREIQELQLQKLQREIENLKMKLLEIHQHTITSRVPITKPRTTPIPTTTTTTTQMPTTTTIKPTTQKPTTTTKQMPTTVKTTTQEPTTTIKPTTTTQSTTTTEKTTTTTTKPTTTTEEPTTTTEQPTTTTTKPTTTEPTTTTTEIPTTTSTYMTTTTVPTTTTESIAVLMRNFLKIFRPMLYRELHMSPQQRVTEPAIIPMTMVKRTTRSPTTTAWTTQRPTTPYPTTTEAPTTTYSPTTTTTTYSPTTPTTTTTTTTPEPTTTKTTLSEKLILKQLLMEHHPDVYNRLYMTQTQGLAKFETTKTTSYPTTDPLTTGMDPYMELMGMADLTSSPSVFSSAATSMRTTKQTTTKAPPTTTTSKTITTTTPQPTTTTTVYTTPSTTTTATTSRQVTNTNKETTVPQTDKEISFYEFLEKAKLANIPIPSKIREELQNVFEKSTTKSTTTRFTTRTPDGQPIPVDPMLLVDFDTPKKPSPVRRWKPPAPIEIFKVQSTQAFTTPRQTTTTTRKSTTVTPAPTTTKTPITEILKKYREMYEQGVDKQKIVQAIFQNIDIDTLMENKALFNDILSPKPSPRQANYSPSTTLGYRFDTEHNYGPGSMNYDSHNYGPSAVHNQNNNMIQYSERQSNRDGSPGLSAYDNRVMGIPVVPFDSKTTNQPFRFAPSFRIDVQEPVGWPSQVNDVQMREYINNGDVSANNVDKSGYGPFETIRGSFDSIAAGNPNSGFVSNNNEGYHPNTRPPVLQLENTVATRHSGLSGHNHGPLVVGPSGSLMDLGMVNKLHNAERPGGGAVIMSKSLGANMVLHAQDTIGGGMESGTLSQNPHDLGPQDFTMKRHSGSLSNAAGHTGGSHLSAPGASLSGERFRLRRSTRNHYPDPHRRREYMLEEQYIVTEGGKLTCAAGEELQCVGIGEFKDVAGINWFCLSMCEGDRCPRSKCQCGCRDQSTDTWRPLSVK